MLLDEPVVFLEDGAELVVGQSDHFVIFDAGHGFGRDHGVDDSFFGGIRDGSEDGVHAIVWKHGELNGSVGLGGAGIGGGEGDENVPGAVAGDAAVTAQAKRNAASEALELMRD